MRFVAAMLALFAWLFVVPASAQIIEIPGRTPAPAETDKENLWLLDLSTGGRVTILLHPEAAPETVKRIKVLTRDHFYDGLTFHRVISGFMAQGGDPKGNGTGGSTLRNLKAEFNYMPHVRGAVAMARAQGEDSANSQFYIMLMPKLGLDRKYTVFGRVIDGMQWVDAIPAGDGEDGAVVSNPVRILHAYIAADNPPAYVPLAPTPAPSLGAPVTLPGAAPATPVRRLAAKAAPAKKAATATK